MRFPKGIIQSNNKNIDYKHRGMGLEDDLNITNQYYADNNIAFIYKKPTPIQVTKVEYLNNKKLIKEAYFKEPSTTDYNGLYKGRYVDFEAKETTSLTSFPLSNIHNHQIKHINNIIDNGGIAFLIVRFNGLDKTYLLFGNDLISYINVSCKKSIPVSYFEEKAYLINEKFIPRIDYLEILNKYGGNNEEEE